VQGSLVFYDEGESMTSGYGPRSLANPPFVQWVIEAVQPDKKDNAVKAKQMEALKRLGHLELKLDEYERAFSAFLYVILHHFRLSELRQSRE